MLVSNAWSAAISLGGSIVALAMTGASAVGAVQLEFAPFGRCVEAFQLPPNTEVVGHLLSRVGEVKAASYTKTGDRGRATFCSQISLIPGDRFRITYGGNIRQATVPVLRLAVNRVTDVVSGIGRRSASVRIQVRNPYTATQLSRNVPTDANGRFSTDFTTDYNIRGGDQITASWTSLQGDFIAVTLRAPFMTVWYQSPSTLLSLNPNASGDLDLTDSGGALLAEAGGTGNALGEVEELLWRRGAVATAASQRVIGSFASDASIVIPNLELEANAATDGVTGRCLGNTSYRIEVQGSADRFVSRTGTTGSDGSFAEDFTVAPFDIQPVDTATVFCRYGTGDEVARSVVVTP
jgi:hypothetical protein